MKNLFKLFLILTLFIGSPVLAETPKAAGQAQVIILADVNIKDAYVTSQEGNLFNIKFSIFNGKGIQTGVKYGARLVSATPQGQVVVDEKIYPEVLTLYEDQVLNKEISYQAPKSLSGKYTLYLTSRNENGFPFSTDYVKDVILTSIVKGVEILPETCSLSVIGEKGSPNYKLAQIVDINQTESLNLTCSALNSSKLETIVAPSFITTEGSVYGALITTNSGGTETINFKPSEKKIFSITLPKAERPGVYYLSFNLIQGENSSNQVNLSYLIRGTTAKFLNLFMDKDYYQKGQTANLSYMWQDVSGQFLRGRSEKDSSFTITTTIVNNKSKECSTPLTQLLAQGTISPKIELPIIITKNCLNPKVIAIIKDGTGQILDQKIYEAKTVSLKHTKINVIYPIIVILIIILVIYLYKKRKNITPMNPDNTDIKKVTNTISTNMILPFLFLLAFGLIPAHKVGATSFTVSYPTIGPYVIFDYGINKSSYFIGDKIKATGGQTAVNQYGYYVTAAGLKASPDPIVGSGLPSSYETGNPYLKTIISDLTYLGNMTVGPIDVTTVLPYGPYTITFLGMVDGGGYKIYGASPTITYTAKTNTMGIGASAADTNSYNSYISGEPIQIIWMQNPTFDFTGPTIVSCTASPGTNNTTAASGVFTTNLAATTTYNISCLDSFGVQALGSKTVTIQPIVVTATLLKLRETENTQVSWTVPASATSCACTVSSTNLAINGTSCKLNSADSGIGNGGSYVGKTYLGSSVKPSSTFNVTCSN